MQAKLARRKNKQMQDFLKKLAHIPYVGLNDDRPLSYNPFGRLKLETATPTAPQTQQEAT